MSDDKPEDLTLVQLRQFRAELAQFKDELARFKSWQEAEIDSLRRDLDELAGHVRKTWPKHKFQGALHHLQRDIDGLRERLEKATTAA